MKPFLTAATLLLLILPELLAGNLGLAFGLPLYGALYFAVTYRRRFGLIGATAAGLILDSIYWREYMCMVFIFPAMILLTLPLVRRWRRQLPPAALLPGTVIGGGMALVNWLLCALWGTPGPGPDVFSLFIFQAIFGGIFMLIFTLTADFLAFKCNLPRFAVRGDARLGREQND